MRNGVLKVNSRSKKGMTLVELIVAMTLTSIFAVLCVMLINPIERTYKSTLKLARAQLLADTLIDSIRKECDDVKHDDKAAVWITNMSGDDSALLSTTTHASNDTSGNTLVIRRNNNFAESIYAGAEINSDISNVTNNPLTPTGTAHAVQNLMKAGEENLKSGYVHFGYYQGKEDDNGFYPIEAYDYTNPVMAKTYGDFTVELHFDQLARKSGEYPAYVVCTVKIMENGKKIYSRSAVLCFAANGSGHGSGSGGGGNHNVPSVRDIEVKIVWDDENNTSVRPAGGVVITLWDKDKTNRLGIYTVSDVSKSIQTFRFTNISTSYAIKDLSITQSADPAADGYLKAAISKNSSGFVIKNKYSNLPVTLLSGTAFNAIVQKDKVQHVVFGSEADIRARVSLTGITPVKAAISGSSLSDRYKLYYVSSSNTAYILSEDGYFIANPDCSHMFEGCKKLTSITWNAGTENNGDFLINTSDTTNMASMFKDCTAMKTFNVKDLVHSACTSTASMFEGCTATEGINLISTWDTSGVKNMSRMFYNYAAKHNKNVSVSIDISTFRFDNCEDMSFMFANDSDKGTITNVTFPLGTSTNLTQYPKLETMEKMFFGCGGLQNITNLNNLNCPELKVADKMFDNCTNIKVLHLENFKMPKCQFESKYNVGAFLGCNNLTTIYLDGWDFSGDTDLRDFFSRRKQLKAVYLNDCTVPSEDYSLEGLFYEASSISTVEMRGIVTNKCYTLRSIFYNCTALKSYDINSWNWDTSNVKYWRTAFYNSRVQTLDISSLDFTGAIDLSYLFQSATSAKIILPAPQGSGSIECPDCVSVIGMFLECKSLTEARNFKYYSFPHEMKYGNKPDEHGQNKQFGSTDLFKSCISLETIDLSGFKMEKATNAGQMFQGCTKLSKVIMSEAYLSACTNLANMFNACPALTEIQMNGIHLNAMTGLGFLANEPLKKLNLSDAYLNKVSTLENLFAKTVNNTTKIYQLQEVDFSGAHLDGCASMKKMFSECETLTKINFASVNAAKVTNCSRMFEMCTGFTTLTINSFNMPANATTERMFSECTNLTSITFVNTSMPKLQRTIAMFIDCHKLKEVNLAGFVTGTSLANCECMFENCYNLSISEGDLSGLNTSNTTCFARMFYNCCYKADDTVSPNSATISISSLSFKKGQYFDWMFNCDAPDKDLLNTIVMPAGQNGTATAAVHTYAMFKNRQSVTEITNLSDFKTGTALKTGNIKILDVTYNNEAASEMFYRVGVSTLDLRGFDFKNLKSAANRMFWGCTELETIYVSPSSVYTTVPFYQPSELFSGCDKLVGRGDDVPACAYADHGDDANYARVNQSAYPGYFTKKD